MKRLEVDSFPSPIGTVTIVADEGRICALDFAGYEERMRRFLAQRYGSYELIPANNPGGISERVGAYFAGDITSLDTLPVSIAGTPFQQQVWQALRTIQPGTVLTYTQLAARVDRPAAYRAVGTTNGRNPIAIVLPCHRVVGTNASLTGYAGGLERKRWLLHHEGVEVDTLIARATR